MGMNSLLLNSRIYFTLTLFKHGGAGGHYLITVSECVQFDTVFFKCQKHQSASQGIQNRLFFVVPTAAGNLASFTKEIRRQLRFPRALVCACPLCAHCTSTSLSLDILSEKKGQKGFCSSSIIPVRRSG